MSYYQKTSEAARKLLHYYSGLENLLLHVNNAETISVKGGVYGDFKWTRNDTRTARKALNNATKIIQEHRSEEDIRALKTALPKELRAEISHIRRLSESMSIPGNPAYSSRPAQLAVAHYHAVQSLVGEYHNAVWDKHIGDLREKVEEFKAAVESFPFAEIRYQRWQQSMFGNFNAIRKNATESLMYGFQGLRSLQETVDDTFSALKAASEEKIYSNKRLANEHYAKTELPVLKRKIEAIELFEKWAETNGIPTLLDEIRDRVAAVPQPTVKTTPERIDPPPPQNISPPPPQAKAPAISVQHMQGIMMLMMRNTFIHLYQDMCDAHLEEIRIENPLLPPVEWSRKELLAVIKDKEKITAPDKWLQVIEALTYPMSDLCDVLMRDRHHRQTLPQHTHFMGLLLQRPNAWAQALKDHPLTESDIPFIKARFAEMPRWENENFPFVQEIISNNFEKEIPSWEELIFLRDAYETLIEGAHAIREKDRPSRAEKKFLLWIEKDDLETRLKSSCEQIRALGEGPVFLRKTKEGWEKIDDDHEPHTLIRLQHYWGTGGIVWPGNKVHEVTPAYAFIAHVVEKIHATRLALNIESLSYDQRQHIQDGEKAFRKELYDCIKLLDDDANAVREPEVDAMLKEYCENYEARRLLDKALAPDPKRVTGSTAKPTSEHRR